MHYCFTQVFVAASTRSHAWLVPCVGITLIPALCGAFTLMLPLKPQTTATHVSGTPTTTVRRLQRKISRIVSFQSSAMVQTVVTIRLLFKRPALG